MHCAHCNDVWHVVCIDQTMFHHSVVVSCIIPYSVCHVIDSHFCMISSLGVDHEGKTKDLVYLVRKVTVVK